MAHLVSSTVDFSRADSLHFFLSLPLSRRRFPIGARLHVKISARSVYFRRKTRVGRGVAFEGVFTRVCTPRGRREKVQAISRATHGQALGGCSRSKRVKGCCCTTPPKPLVPRATHLPNPNVRSAVCIAGALALNMLLRASCQRRSKVPSRTTYCRDMVLFFFLPLYQREKRELLRAAYTQGQDRRRITRERVGFFEWAASSAFCLWAGSTTREFRLMILLIIRSALSSV